MSNLESTSTVVRETSPFNKCHMKKGELLEADSSKARIHVPQDTTLDENAHPNKWTVSPDIGFSDLSMERACDDISSESQCSSSSSSLTFGYPFPLLSIFPFECSACSLCESPRADSISSWHHPRYTQLPSNPSPSSLRHERLQESVGIDPFPPNSDPDEDFTLAREDNPADKETFHVPSKSSSLNEKTGHDTALFITLDQYGIAALKDLTNKYTSTDVASLSTLDDVTNNEGDMSNIDGDMEAQLEIDLSWLDEDDDEAFERKTLSRVVGERIQVFSPEQNNWRSGVVMSELADGRYFVIYLNGDSDLLKLSTRLWRRVS